jgi:hypothetical protein
MVNLTFPLGHPHPKVRPWDGSRLRTFFDFFFRTGPGRGEGRVRGTGREGGIDPRLIS